MAIIEKDTTYTLQLTLNECKILWAAVHHMATAHKSVADPEYLKMAKRLKEMII